MSILVVDDTKVDRVVTKVVLKKGGFTDVVYADSGIDALAKLGIPDGEPVPELHDLEVICVDWQMPGVDGIEFCRILREDDRYRDVPIIMVTASEEEQTLVEAFEAGATDFVRKPIKSVEFLARVRVAIRLHREIAARKAHEKLLAQRFDVLQTANEALRNALARIKKLPQHLPVCSVCHKIQVDEDRWMHIEDYIREYFHSELQLSICPDCYRARIQQLEQSSSS